MSNIKKQYSYLVFLLILKLFILGLTYCDHLLQTTDELKDSTAKEQATSEKAQQRADPEFVKKGLKDLILMQLDKDQDGQVSYEELKNWLPVLDEKNIEYNVDEQWRIYSPQIHEVFSWEGYEPEKKEVLTWDHYFNQTYPELIGVDIGIPINREQDTSRILNPTEAPKEFKAGKKPEDEENDDPHFQALKLMAERADARWKLADENGDTLLTKSEFKHLLYPDEGHEELQNLFIREATEDMDLDTDGKISLDEFMKHMEVLAEDQERNDPGWLSSQHENFGRFLDKDKDGVLDGDEIKDWLVPPKSKKYEVQAKRFLDIGDANEDHKLSYSEILQNYEQYLTILPVEYWKASISETTDPANEILTNRDEL